MGRKQLILLLAFASVGQPAIVAGQTASPTAPDVASADMVAAQSLLRNTISALTLGAPNFGDMEEPVASAVRVQSRGMNELFAQLGPVQSLTHDSSQDGLHHFTATYANGRLIWIIGLTKAGKIHTLTAQPDG